jgi:hypothetical protein
MLPQQHQPKQGNVLQGVAKTGELVASIQARQNQLMRMMMQKVHFSGGLWESSMQIEVRNQNARHKI